MPTYSLADIVHKVSSPRQDISRFRTVQQAAIVDQLKVLIDKVENGTVQDRTAIGVFALFTANDLGPDVSPTSQITEALEQLYWELIESFFVSGLPLVLLFRRAPLMRLFQLGLNSQSHCRSRAVSPQNFQSASQKAKPRRNPRN